MTAFSPPPKPETPSRLTRQDQFQLRFYRQNARTQSTKLRHTLSPFTPFRIANGHPTTVAVCEKCGAEVTIVLQPADGSYPVQGPAVTDRCRQ